MKVLIASIIIWLSASSFANSKKNTSSFLLYVDSITSKKEFGRYFCILDQSHPMTLDSLSKKNYDEFGYSKYFPEVKKYLEGQLILQGYKKAKCLEFSGPGPLFDQLSVENEELPVPDIRIDMAYFVYPHDIQNKYVYFTAIEFVSYEHQIPLWETKTITTFKDSSGSLRIDLPYIIKCATPYFNKNFKGAITCNR